MTTPQAAAQDQAAPAPGVTLAEIEQLVRDILPAAGTVMVEAPALGAYAPAWRWLAAAQGVERPTLRHPRLAFFATAGAAASTVEEIAKGRHAIARIAAEANADLQIYELGSEGPTTGALTETEAAHAFSYGLMAVQPGIDLIVLAALDPAGNAAAEKLQAALQTGASPLGALMAAGRLDICAIAGAMAAARLAKTPVLLDGPAASAAAALLAALRADAAAHGMTTGALMPAPLLNMPGPNMPGPNMPGPDMPGLAGAMLVPLLKAVAATSAV